MTTAPAQAGPAPGRLVDHFEKGLDAPVPLTLLTSRPDKAWAESPLAGLRAGSWRMRDKPAPRASRGPRRPGVSRATNGLAPTGR